MIRFFNRHAAALAAGGLSLALSACAPGRPAETGMETAMPSRVTMESQEARGRAETRIGELHDKLHITPAQEPQFEAVADAIRANESALYALTGQRDRTAGVTAVEDLRLYKKLADAHAAGLARFIPPFEDLYDTMSDAQKANADKVFSTYEGHGWHKGFRGHRKENYRKKVTG